MPLIICPKTTEKVIAAYTACLDLHKIPKKDGHFWHSNFNDSFYQGLDGRVNVLFTGYSGAVAGQAILEYVSQYQEKDPRPEIYFIGSVYAFKDSSLEPGDLVYAEDTYSPDSFEQAIYENAKGREIPDVGRPDSRLLAQALQAAARMRVQLHPSKVYCRITPGIFPQFVQPSELMNQAMWWKISLSPIPENGYDSGEYESASVLATSRLVGIPAIALMDVKDKRYSEAHYVIASDEQKKQALHSLLRIVREMIMK